MYKKKYLLPISLTQIESDSWLYPHGHQLCEEKGTPTPKDVNVALHHLAFHISTVAAQSVPLKGGTLYTRHTWATGMLMEVQVSTEPASLGVL